MDPYGLVQAGHKGALAGCEWSGGVVTVAKESVRRDRGCFTPACNMQKSLTSGTTHLSLSISPISRSKVV